MQITPSANLSGLMKIIPASKFQLTPIFEAITNSIESIATLSNSEDSKIEICLHFNDQDKDHLLIEKVSIEDNGAGFNDVALSRFKEILDSSKGHNNRGTGRLQFFHRFEEISIDSNYVENNEWQSRNFKCNKQHFIYGSEIAKPSNVKAHLTHICMYGFCAQKGDNEFFSKLTFEKFTALIRAQFALRAYLEGAKGSVMPTLILKFKYQVEKLVQQTVIKPEDFPVPQSKGSFEVDYIIPRLGKDSKIQWNKDQETPPESFQWAVFEFDEDDIEAHGAFLCSKDVPVKEIKNPVLRKKTSYKGKKKLTVFYGDYLDIPTNVSDAVDSFRIQDRDSVKVSDLTKDLFGIDGYVYLDDIQKEAKLKLAHIYEEVANAQEALEKDVLKIAKSLGISISFAKKVQTKISLLDNDDTITAKLYEEEAAFLADKSNKARKIIDSLNQLDPTSEGYHDTLSQKSEKLSLLIDEQNKEELSKYIVRREMVATLLGKILNVELHAQNKLLEGRKNRDREGIIHDLIFKRKQSIGPNDLWILNEEFVHFDGFSEKRLEDILLPTGEKLVSEKFKTELEEFGFNTNKRPDIFLFAGEGKCVLVELKEPGTNLSHYLHQMPQYCKLLANYSRIEIKNFYCYLIGEKISPEADLDEYEESVTGDWFRDSIPVKKAGGNRERIASIRMEIIKLSSIHERAHRRNKNFASKLGLDSLFNK